MRRLSTNGAAAAVSDDNDDDGEDDFVSISWPTVCIILDTYICDGEKCGGGHQSQNVKFQHFCFFLLALLMSAWFLDLRFVLLVAIGEY